MKKEKGIALALAIIVLGVLLILLGGLYSLLNSDYALTAFYYRKQKVLGLAEAGIDKAIYQLNTNPSYTGETTSLSEGGFVTTLSTIDNRNAIIESKGCYPSVNDCQAKKIIRVTVTTNPNATSYSFHYAVHIGNGGLEMYSNATVKGNVYSNGNITGSGNSEITGDAYAVGTISSPAPKVDGTKHPNATPQPLPSLDFDFWRNQANINNDPYNGNYQQNSCPNPIPSLGPKKIVGNFTMNSNSCLKITGPLYITGNFEMNSNSQLYLDDSFGRNGTVIVVDGTIKLNSNAYIYPTNSNPKGYIMLATPSSASPAVEVNANASQGIIFAPNGEIQLNSNGKVTEIIGKKLVLNSNAILEYDQGLISASFTSGPGGSWTVVPGTWVEIK